MKISVVMEDSKDSKESIHLFSWIGIGGWDCQFGAVMSESLIEAEIKTRRQRECHEIKYIILWITNCFFPACISKRQK